jgi:hypothetical protein
MPQNPRLLLIVLLIGVILTAGCSSILNEKNSGTNASQTSVQPAASWQVTIHQPNVQSDYIKMDTDIYNIGEVIEFTVTNNGSHSLSCAGSPPSFSVKFQAVNGIWATRMGTEKPNETVKSTLAPGTSTQVYRFVTTGWDPDRYRIVSDCGVFREFILRPVPALVKMPEDLPSATPAVTGTGAANTSVGNPLAAPHSTPAAPQPPVIAPIPSSM